MKKILLLVMFSILVMLSISLSAQTTLSNKTIAGSWSGKLSTGEMDLRVVFNLKLNGKDSLSCTLDSPDQGAADIPCGKVTLDKQELVVLAPNINGEYKGKVTNDSTITGIWSQNGTTLPLELKRKIKK